MKDAVQDNHPQLARIEQLLREGNQLRSDTLAMQQQLIAAQRELLAEQRANLARAAEINDGAVKIQKRASALQTVVIPLIIVALLFVGYLLFRGAVR